LVNVGNRQTLLIFATHLVVFVKHRSVDRLSANVDGVVQLLVQECATFTRDLVPRTAVQILPSEAWELRACIQLLDSVAIRCLQKDLLPQARNLA
jgi:hypothetical protein